ncbi:hypothetical protein [Nocardioides sediminis]|uniref:hypothetical protein n=1 Tax=Nocardioides sediminis TaxID=433648 RepID=UPI00131F0BBC|nr:hypothetical protein [Nocardioides sediminis]
MRRTTITATALLAVTALVGCSAAGPAEDRAAPGTSTGGAGVDASGDGGAEATTAAPVTVGEHPYVWPCRLLTPTDAVDLFPLTEEADFSEIGRAVSPGEAEMAEMKGTVSGQRVYSSCAYDFGDPARTQAALKIDQYRTEEQAAAQWHTIKKFGDGKLPPRSDPGSPFFEAEQALRAMIKDGKKSVGGVRLPGLDDRILWRVGTNEFVATTGSVFLTFTRKRDSGITDDLTKRDARLAETVLTRALDRVGDPDLGTPTDPWFVQDADWPAFLAPCSLLDDEAVGLLFPGVPLEEVALRSVDAAPDVNTASDSPAGRSHDNSCRRSDVDDDHSTELRVQYVAPGDDAEEVLDSHLSNLFFDDPTIRPGRVRTIRAGLQAGGLYDVDASYVLVTQRRETYYYALMDRYLLELEARQVAKGAGQGRGGFPDLESVDTYTLKTGMEVVVENVLETLGSSDDSASVGP